MLTKIEAKLLKQTKLHRGLRAEPKSTRKIQKTTSNFSMPNMTGRPGYRTIIVNGNDWRKFRAVPRSYPLRSFVCTSFNRGGNRGVFRLPGAGGGSFPLYGGTFAQSYSVSKFSLFFICVNLSQHTFQIIVALNLSYDLISHVRCMASWAQSTAANNP